MFLTIFSAAFRTATIKLHTSVIASKVFLTDAASAEYLKLTEEIKHDGVLFKWHCKETEKTAIFQNALYEFLFRLV